MKHLNYNIDNAKLEIITKLSEVISEEKNTLFAYLHGSFLTDENFKDLDVGVYLKGEFLKKIKPVDYEISFSLKLEKIIKIPVDVKILNISPLSFKYRVTSNYLLKSNDKNKRESFLCKTWDEYFDFLPVAKIYLKEMLK